MANKMLVLGEKGQVLCLSMGGTGRFRDPAAAEDTQRKPK